MDEAVAADSLHCICIRAPNWVGDVVMATPTFRAVRGHFPHAHITAIVRRHVEPVLRGGPWFDEKLIYGPRPGRTVWEFVRCAARLRRGGYELGLVLPNSFSSALMLRMGGVRRRIGYARDCRSFLLTDAAPRPSENGRFKPTYMVDCYLALCERLGVQATDRHTELPFTEEDAAGANRILAGQGAPGAGLFLLHPGAGFGPSKRWPSERFSRLAELLEREFGACIAIIGGKDERSTVAEIVTGSRARIVDLTQCGIDLHLLKCVVARSKLLVTTDSGPRHYGVALGVPTVCVIGPTHPDYSTSDRPNDHLVRLDVDCGPCQKKVCPRDHRCMEDISAEMVFETCRAALSQQPGGVGNDPA
jgi:heptosyltransferase-2